MNEIATIDLTRDKIDLLKRTVAKGSTDDEFQLFIELCRKRGLDPFARQIHFTKNGVITGIDGFRVIAERTGCYAPGATRYIESEGALIAAEVCVKKKVGAEWFDVVEVAYLNEYRGQTPIWQKMPRVMLAKCAEARALRRAFPTELSGLYATEEMDQAERHDTIEPIIEVQARPADPSTLADKLMRAEGWFNKNGIETNVLEEWMGLARRDWGADEFERISELSKQAKKLSAGDNQKIGYAVMELVNPESLEG